MKDLKKFIKTNIREFFDKNNSRLLLESKDYGYFKDRTTVPDYDAILFNKTDELPKMYMNWTGEVKFMTLEEYINECAKLQGTSYEEQFKYINDANVSKIQKNMDNGVKYNMPYLNYVDKTQEGRHRVVAASNLGQKEIPVLILKKEDEDFSTDNISDMIGKWDDLVKLGDDYYCFFSNEYDLLSCVVRDYDYYYLDSLMDIKKQPSLYGKNVVDYINRMIKENNNAPLSYLASGVNFKNIDDNTKQKYWGVVTKIMENNYYLIIDAVKIVNNKYYLKVLNNIKDDFSQYKSCKDMLMSNVNQKYYVEEYNLVSADDKQSFM